MERITAIRGTRDVLPEEIELWQFIEGRSRDLFNLYGYKEIRTPILESAKLFQRSVGESTDIVQKEMFVFTDRGKRQLALRPEATASVVRAYIEHGFGQRGGVTKFYYIGPMFRGERPQAGRSRQFHQIGIEAIGSGSAILDAEAICLLTDILRLLGIQGFKICLNNIGCQKDKATITSDLKRRLEPYLDGFCQDCQRRISRNVFRVLDCKQDRCRHIIKNDIFSKRDYTFSVCDECRGHFESLKKILDSLKIAYELEPSLARGIDYYTRTIFEIIHPALGAKDALGAGGRYDHLVRDMGGEDTGAIGWSLGFERLVMVIGSLAQREVQREDSVDFYIAPLSEMHNELAFRLLSKLRKIGISSDMDYTGRSLKAQLKTADKLNARFTALLGDDEVKKGVVTVRNMETGEQTAIKIDNFEDDIRTLLRTPGVR